MKLCQGESRPRLITLDKGCSPLLCEIHLQTVTTSKAFSLLLLGLLSSEVGVLRRLCLPAGCWGGLPECPRTGPECLLCARLRIPESCLVLTTVLRGGHCHSPYTQTQRHRHTQRHTQTHRHTHADTPAPHVSLEPEGFNSCLCRPRLSRDDPSGSFLSWDAVWMARSRITGKELARRSQGPCFSEEGGPEQGWAFPLAHVVWVVGLVGHRASVGAIQKEPQMPCY